MCSNGACSGMQGVLFDYVLKVSMMCVQFKNYCECRLLSEGGWELVRWLMCANVCAIEFYLVQATAWRVPDASHVQCPDAWHISCPDSPSSSAITLRMELVVHERAAQATHRQVCHGIPNTCISMSSGIPSVIVVHVCNNVMRGMCMCAAMH